MIDKPTFVGTAIALLIWSFVKSMYYWGKDGFRVVPLMVTWKRRALCQGCTGYPNGKGRCPTCGCFIKFITKLNTSHCANWDKFWSRWDGAENSPYIYPTEK